MGLRKVCIFSWSIIYQVGIKNTGAIITYTVPAVLGLIFMVESSRPSTLRSSYTNLTLISRSSYDLTFTVPRYCYTITICSAACLCSVTCVSLRILTHVVNCVNSSFIEYMCRRVMKFQGWKAVGSVAWLTSGCYVGVTGFLLWKMVRCNAIIVRREYLWWNHCCMCQVETDLILVVLNL